MKILIILFFVLFSSASFAQIGRTHCIGPICECWQDDGPSSICSNPNYSSLAVTDSPSVAAPELSGYGIAGGFIALGILLLIIHSIDKYPRR